MAYETLIVEIEDYTALIRLNRPEALNALVRRPLPPPAAKSLPIRRPAACVRW